MPPSKSVRYRIYTITSLMRIDLFALNARQVLIYFEKQAVIQKRVLDVQLYVHDFELSSWK